MSRIPRLCLLLSILFWLLMPKSVGACVIGCAMGNATTDGRPFSWKNREGSGTHFVWYVTSGGRYNYLAVGNAEGLKMGVNQAGLSLQNSLIWDISSPGFTYENNIAFKNYCLSTCGSVAEVRQAIIEDTSLTVDHWPPPSMCVSFSDAHGYATTFELGAEIYYEYDPTNPNRLAQFPRQFVVRANASHQNPDETDDATTGGNTYVTARNDMQYCADNGGLNVSNWINAVARHGEPGVDTVKMPSNSDVPAVMLLHGVNEGEDPRIVTSWLGLGNPDYTCFIPAWVAQQNNLSPRTTSGDTNNSIGGLAERLFSKHDGNHYDQYINGLLRPMEDNIIEGVTAARARWLANGFNLEEATRIHMEACETAWQTMNSMVAGSGRNLNVTPSLTAINTSINGLQVTFECTANDSDGSIIQYDWDFGDGNYSTSPTPLHTYSSTGTYLVRCRVVDTGGSRNSKWKYVTVSEGNQSPTISITAPVDGASFSAGVPISFTASASDAEDGDLTANLLWTSSLSGNIGTGGSFSLPNLAVGVHKITASVTDSGGANQSAQITVTVLPSGWTAYNDCVYDSTKYHSATDPNGQLVTYKAANVTTFGIGTGYSGPTSGILLDKSTGISTGVMVRLTQSGGVTWLSDVSSAWYGGYDTARGTDARNTFGGISDMTGTIHYGTSGWWVDLTFTGLNPAKTYTFATSASRANSTYTNRNSRYTISGVDAATNASTTGVNIIDNYSVWFNTGDNHNTGYVARWTDIQPGADGSFKVRAQAYGGEYRAYAFDVFMLQEEGDASPTITISGTVKSGGSPLANVVMSGLPGNPVTNANGVYTGTVGYGWSGTVTPTLAGYTFTPASKTYSSVTSNQTQDYTTTAQTFTISGTVTSGGSPLANVVMSGLPGNPVTNASGVYSGTVSYGWSGTVTPTLAGYTFTPASKTYSSITSNQTQDYTTTAQTNVRIIGSPKLYGLIQLAYNDAADGAVIQAKGITFTENLTLNTAKAVTLMGGFDSSFFLQNGYSLLEGVLTVEQGSLIVDRLTIK